MTSQSAVSIDDICRRGSIRDTEVQRLRRLVFAEGSITGDEAKELMRVSAACTTYGASWPEFFIEAITDYVINEAEPRGYITAANSAWIIDQLSKDGRAITKTEVELLVNLLDKARWAPESLVRFALEQVQHAVSTGEGALRQASDAGPGEITESEVELLRRMLYAFAGDGSIAVTRAEAEVLFAINDCLRPEAMEPAFSELFVKAVANAVMAASGYAVPSREEALRREAWLASRGEMALPEVLGAMARGWLTGTYAEQSGEQAALARLERQRIEIITNEEVTQGEVAWLADRIGRDGTLTANEQALLAYLKRESPRLHPSIETVISRLQQAA